MIVYNIYLLLKCCIPLLTNTKYVFKDISNLEIRLLLNLVATENHSTFLIKFNIPAGRRNIALNITFFLYHKKKTKI